MRHPSGANPRKLIMDRPDGAGPQDPETWPMADDDLDLRSLSDDELVETDSLSALLPAAG